MGGGNQRRMVQMPIEINRKQKTEISNHFRKLDINRGVGFFLNDLDLVAKLVSGKVGKVIVSLPGKRDNAQETCPLAMGDGNNGKFIERSMPLNSFAVRLAPVILKIENAENFRKCPFVHRQSQHERIPFRPVR